MKNVLTRIGGARNCLLVYVADGALTIVPVFPFNLMFLPEIYGLETTAPISAISANSVDGLLRKQLVLTIAGIREERFELSLRDEQAFRDAIEGTRTALIKPSCAKRSDRPRTGWQINFVRIFAVIWGAAAVVAGLFGLEEDIRFRLDGVTTNGSVVGHTGKIGARDDAGIVRYEVGGHQYTLTSIRGSGVYKIGDLEKVYYMPHVPARAREEDYLSFDVLFVCLGSCMLILAFTITRIVRIFTRSLNV